MKKQQHKFYISIILNERNISKDFTLCDSANVSNMQEARLEIALVGREKLIKGITTGFWDFLSHLC